MKYFVSFFYLSMRCQRTKKEEMKKEKIIVFRTINNQAIAINLPNCRIINISGGSK